MLLRVLAAFVIAGVSMAILVPVIHARGTSLRGWMAWTVIAMSLAVAIGPGLWQRWRARRG